MTSREVFEAYQAEREAHHAALVAKQDTTRHCARLRELIDVVRDQALDLGWPVWQPGQHFCWLDEDGREMEGDAVWLDIEAQTVDARVWPMGDIIAELRGDTARRVVPFAALLPYDYELDKARRAAEAQEHAAFREAHPLFPELDEVSA